MKQKILHFFNQQVDSCDYPTERFHFDQKMGECTGHKGCNNTKNPGYRNRYNLINKEQMSQFLANLRVFKSQRLFINSLNFN